MVYKSSHNNDFVTSVNSETGDIDITSNGGTINITTPTSHTINLEAAPIPGGVTTTGTPAAGNLTKFSAAATITNGDLSGDVTTSGTLATTVAKIQSTVVSGTTGATNVVFSASPTLTGSPLAPTQATSDNSTKLATTAYVTTAIANAVAGVNPAVAVQAATTQASDTSGLTYLNGVSGVGATLTGIANTALTIDGYTFTATGQRLLVKNDTQSPSGAYNGVYYVTQIQTAILPIILTRALDYNQPSDINNTGAIPVINGTANTDTSWIITSTVNTVGTDPLTYVQFTKNPATLLTTTLTSAHVLVGNGSNLATDVAVSGDLTLANTGAFTVAKIQSTVVSGTSGSGNVAFTTSPVFTTPNIGTATGSVSGNAGTATALQTAHTIGGVSFNGTADITVASATGGFAVSGGSLTSTGQIHPTLTTQQLLLSYDGSNSAGYTVSSTGSLTLDLTGTSPTTTFTQRTFHPGGLSTNTTFGNANFGVPATTGTSTTTTAQCLIGGATTIDYRLVSRGSTNSTVGVGDAYASWILGQTAVTEAASGVHPIFAQLAVRPLAVTAGVATVTNSATVYIEDADNTTTVSGAYALWVDAGEVRIDGAIGDTTNRTSKLWATDIESTNAPSIGGVAATGTGGIQRAINSNSAKTTAYNLLTTDSSATFTNLGAVGSVTFTLPAAAVGLTYLISCDAAQTVVLAANTGDKIRMGASLTASAGNLTSDATVSCCVRVECTSANLWRVTFISGTWTVN